MDHHGFARFSDCPGDCLRSREAEGSRISYRANSAIRHAHNLREDARQVHPASFQRRWMAVVASFFSLSSSPAASFRESFTVTAAFLINRST